MTGRPINLAGLAVGALNVLERQENTKWLCECFCGKRVERTTSHLMEARKLGRMPNCGCRPRGGRAKYAILYRGELRSVAEVAAMTGRDKRNLLRIAKRGLLSEAWLDERAAFEAKIERQKAAGVSHDTLYQRLRKLGWSEDRARFTPVRKVG